MFENKNEPLLSKKAFYSRIIKYSVLSIGILIISIVIGTVGYHLLGKLGWIDSFYNASMILGGMGPVDLIHGKAGKLFASFYALYSGIAFLVLVGVLFAPIFHRFLHVIHVDIDE